MQAMAQSFDVCIRGAGIVGRTLALLLARERLRVALVATPPAPDAARDVRAYALNTSSRQLLASLRLARPVHATALRHMEVFGDEGGSVHFDAGAQSVDALGWIVDVPALENRLVEAVRYQPLVEVVERPVDAPLTAICEGRASSTRSEFGVEFDVTPYPQHALATRLVCEKPHGQVARQWFSADGILALLPLDGADGHTVAVVWSTAPKPPSNGKTRRPPISPPGCRS
jgi:2-polyprenyl-6-methoxyphenol hydroxylase-like FAD-dependent oxidoreductase